MNASVLKRTLVIAAVVAVPWIGCSLWSARREAADREALAAEIRAEMTALPPEPDRTAGRVDRTAEYAEILRPLGSVPLPAEFHTAHSQEATWDAVPVAVAGELEARATALAAMDALARREEGGFFTGSAGAAVGRGLPMLGRLLFARGRAQVVDGDIPGLLGYVRVLRKLAGDVVASAGLAPDLNPELLALEMEDSALRLLGIAAVHPALSEEDAREGLALAADGSILDAVYRGVARASWSRGERLVLDLLGDGAREILEKDGMLDDDPAPRTVPSAAVLRRVRDFARRIEEFEARRDGAAFLVGGPLDREAEEGLGDGWTARALLVGAYGGRWQWTSEARLPVLRAAFGVRLHELRAGRMPATLTELVPSMFDAVPLDRWTGQPVKFTTRSGGWNLEAGPPEATLTHEDGVMEMSRPYRLEK